MSKREDFTPDVGEGAAVAVWLRCIQELRGDAAIVRELGSLWTKWNRSLAPVSKDLRVISLHLRGRSATFRKNHPFLAPAEVFRLYLPDRDT